MITRNWNLPKSDPNELRVVQFNVLADSLSYSDPNNGGFDLVSRDCLSPVHRIPLISEEIRRFSPHLIGLQEVDILPVIPPSYSLSLFKKPNNADGCALAYDTQRFIALENPTSFALGEGANQLAALVVLRDIIYKEIVIFCTTHLKAKKEHENTRVNQIDIIFDHLNTIVNSYKEVVTVIIAGDFNSVPNELVYMNVENKGALSSMAILNNGKEPKRTTCKSRKGIKVSHTIDYIFYCGDGYTPNRFVEIPTEEEIDILPSISYPSDHFALCVAFVKNRPML